MNSKDNSPDLSLSSQELNSFDREKLLELAYEKDKIKEEDSFNFIVFNELMSYEESEEVEENNNEQDKDDNEEEKIIKPKMKEKNILFTSLNEMGMSI